MDAAAPLTASVTSTDASDDASSLDGLMTAPLIECGDEWYDADAHSSVSFGEISDSTSDCASRDCNAVDVGGATAAPVAASTPAAHPTRPNPGMDESITDETTPLERWEEEAGHALRRGKGQYDRLVGIAFTHQNDVPLQTSLVEHPKSLYQQLAFSERRNQDDPGLQRKTRTNARCNNAQRFVQALFLALFNHHDSTGRLHWFRAMFAPGEWQRHVHVCTQLSTQTCGDFVVTTLHRAMDSLGPRAYRLPEAVAATLKVSLSGNHAKGMACQVCGTPLGWRSHHRHDVSHEPKYGKAQKRASDAASNIVQRDQGAKKQRRADRDGMSAASWVARGRKTGEGTARAVFAGDART